MKLKLFSVFQNLFLLNKKWPYGHFLSHHFISEVM